MVLLQEYLCPERILYLIFHGGEAGNRGQRQDWREICRKSSVAFITVILPGHLYAYYSVMTTPDLQIILNLQTSLDRATPISYQCSKEEDMLIRGEVVTIQEE
ncbi:hypothetical protein SDC9_180646 [bioreactor metagenome]|uniref:Uncharacterized protein n=1 Tax=bioreactor metagenome TaxID=1076179 RepID=A0A645H4A9_9ZZZZ